MTGEITPEAVAAEYDWEQFQYWVQRGIEAGWISPPICETHEGSPMRDWEAESFEEGEDPCILIMRVWKDGYS